MAALAALEEDAGKHDGDDDGDDQSSIAPLAGVPAEGELRQLVNANEECTVLCKVDGVQVDTGSHGLHEAEHGDGLGHAQGHHDGQHDNADGDNGAGTGHGGEDNGGHDVQQGDGDHGTVAAQFDGLTDQGGGDTGLHQDAAEPGAPADVDQRGAPAFGSRLINRVEDVDDGQRLTVLVERGGSQELRGSECGAQEGQHSPDNGDDQEADHQVMALDAVVCEAKEREEQQNANYNLQGKYPFLL